MTRSWRAKEAVVSAMAGNVKHLISVTALAFTCHVLAAGAFAAGAAGNDPGALSAAHRPKIMTVVLENTSYEEALEQPFLSSLAHEGALLTHLSSERHPSQPNYIALISGSTQGVSSDKKVDLDGR